VVAVDASELIRQALALVCQDVLVGTVKGKLDDFWSNLVRQSDRLDGLDKQAAQFAGHHDQLETQHNALTEDVEVLSGRVDNVGQALDGLRTQLPVDLNRLQQSLDSCLEQWAAHLADEQAAARETRLDEVAARLREEQQTARTEWSQALETVDRGLASLHDETRLLETANQKALHTLNQRLSTEWKNRLGQVEDRLSTEWRNRLDQVEDRLASAIHTIEELRAAQARRPWSNWMRTLVRGLGFPLGWLKRPRHTEEIA
jgi:chromosome segregation ATPase